MSASPRIERHTVARLTLSEEVKRAVIATLDEYAAEIDDPSPTRSLRFHVQVKGDGKVSNVRFSHERGLSIYE